MISPVQLQTVEMKYRLSGPGLKEVYAASIPVISLSSSRYSSTESSSTRERKEMGCIACGFCLFWDIVRSSLLMNGLSSVFLSGAFNRMLRWFVQVRVLCGRAAYAFWFQVAKPVTEESPLVCCKA